MVGENSIASVRRRDASRLMNYELILPRATDVPVSVGPMKGLRAAFNHRTTQQHSAILCGYEPELCVERKCGCIAVSYLDVNELAASRPVLSKELAEQSIRSIFATEPRFDVQVINVAAQAAMLHGVADSEHRMSNGHGTRPECTNQTQPSSGRASS
jgi:hypothetical protein